MSSASPTPMIAGVAQVTQRLDDPNDALSPIQLMEKALRDAAEDAGAPKLLAAIDAIYVPKGLWQYGDPGRLLAEAVGAGSATTGLGAISGHIVQTLIDQACREIAEGRRQVVAIVGGESENSKRRLAKQGSPIWDEQIPGEPDLRVGKDLIDLEEHEVALGLLHARNTFAICDTAWRYDRGETPLEHRDRIAELSSRLSTVGARNPNGWFDQEFSAEEIRTPTPGNRMVTYPYTKLMTSNIAVDQAGAILLCSDEVAARLGVTSQPVYLRAAAEMHHSRSLSRREHLYRHPGMHRAAQRVLELGAVEASQLDCVDVYSCFPMAVQAGADALGLPEDAALSVTGGLTFGGGPLANYVIQSTARTVELLREQPGSLGLVGSIGGSFAKFAFGLYSTDPGDLPSAGLRIGDVSDEFAQTPEAPFLTTFDGETRVESYLVDVGRDGPEAAIFSTKTDAGERVWGRSEDPALMAALLGDEEACGRRARVRGVDIELI